MYFTYGLSWSTQNLCVPKFMPWAAALHTRFAIFYEVLLTFLLTHSERWQLQQGEKTGWNHDKRKRLLLRQFAHIVMTQFTSEPYFGKLLFLNIINLLFMFAYPIKSLYEHSFVYGVFKGTVQTIVAIHNLSWHWKKKCVFESILMRILMIVPLLVSSYCVFTPSTLSLSASSKNTLLFCLDCLPYLALVVLAGREFISWGGILI